MTLYGKNHCSLGFKRLKILASSFHNNNMTNWVRFTLPNINFSRTVTTFMTHRNTWHQAGLLHFAIDFSVMHSIYNSFHDIQHSGSKLFVLMPSVVYYCVSTLAIGQSIRFWHALKQRWKLKQPELFVVGIIYHLPFGEIIVLFCFWNDRTLVLNQPGWKRNWLHQLEEIGLSYSTPEASNLSYPGKAMYLPCAQ